MAPVIAGACGVCVDDKVAATYDYAVVQRAEARGQAVVYCEAHGSLDAQQLKARAARVKGLDAATLRVSQQPAAVSFALDPTRQSPEQAAAALVHGMPGVRLTVIRVLEPTPAS